MYNWLVFLHILFAFAFMLAHGVQAVAMLLFRVEKEPRRTLAFLELLPNVTSARVLVVLMTIPGVAAAIVAGWWRQAWTWGSAIVFLVVALVMWRYGGSYFQLLEEAGRHVEDARNSGGNVDAALGAYERARLAPHSILLTLIGGIGLAVLLWLMTFKPF